MRHLRLALAAAASALILLPSRTRAQDEEEKNRPPPVEIPDFSNLDEFIYVPKSTLTVGFRMLSGAKTRFSGTGHLVSTTDDPGDPNASNVERRYHDGNVHVDGRGTPRIDADGNPIVDPTTGAAIIDPIAPDGRTNSWNYLDAKQQTADGLLGFHVYTADVVDSATRKIDGARNAGMELAVNRDMGKLFGTRATWTLMAGMSVNDLAAKTSANVLASVTTITDLFSLNGQPIPDAPYSAPSSSSTTVTDSNGNPVTNDDGTTQSATVDTTTLLGSKPVGHTTGTASDSTSVLNHWRLHGAYYTFRAGPSIFVPVTSRLRLSLSVGAAVAYAGSTYEVTQVFTPDTGEAISDTSSSTIGKLLPGYYADASVQFDLTERAGLYAGAVFQSTGAYTQTINSDAAHYATRIDLANQNGLRAGMTIRF